MLTCSNRHRYLFISEILSSERCDVTCLALLIIKSLKFSLNGKFSDFDSIEKLFDFEFSYEIHKSIEKNSLHHVWGREILKFRNFFKWKSKKPTQNIHYLHLFCVSFFVIEWCIRKICLNLKKKVTKSWLIINVMTQQMKEIISWLIVRFDEICDLSSVALCVWRWRKRK